MRKLLFEDWSTYQGEVLTPQTVPVSTLRSVSIKGDAVAMTLTFDPSFTLETLLMYKEEVVFV